MPQASLKPLATAKRDGKWSNMDAALLVPGDLILLASGSAVPADCLVNHGTIDVDQSGLTGESMPVTMYKVQGGGARACWRTVGLPPPSKRNSPQW
jgi:H+-transporting ATPase